jgi:hypothetical protein
MMLGLSGLETIRYELAVVENQANLARLEALKQVLAGRELQDLKKEEKTIVAEILKTYRVSREQVSEYLKKPSLKLAA